ncbi:unnamed protein product [Allacma fusca]|uniref:FAS1 domain-containing protein n=1 Tax=Allacma fusca TaxID=39272 RepID=A0A8J2P8F1_9HEXA|nr:unnamed protein product [Allacma fusca]
MLDDVLIPDRARTLLELVDSRQLFIFAQLIRVAGLEDLFSNPADYTLFAPTEPALYTLEEEWLDEAKSSPELARKIFMKRTTAVS